MRADPQRLRGRLPDQLIAPVAGALAMVGAGAALASSSIQADPTVGVPRGDRPVNAGAGDPGDIRANNSPALARNPRRPGNLAVANRIDSPSFSCALHVSFDGGSRWSSTRVPVPRGEEPKCYAPDLAFTSDGTLHMSFVTLRGAGNVPNAAWVVDSRDGGRTLGRPRRVLGRLAYQVRLAADPADPRRLYLSWLQASEVALYRFTRPGNPILVTRSDDGGANWRRPVRVSAPSRERALAPSPAVGPRGEVYVLYLDLGEDRLDYEGAHEGLGGPPHPGRFQLVLGRSVDAGGTWAESVIERRIVPSERFVAFLPPFPSLAVDRRNGRLYAGFHDGRLGERDVWVWSLGAGQSSWEGPTRVNDTPERDGTSQYLPRLAVAPGGRLDVVYYDRRSDPRNVRMEVSLQSSFDGGRSFTPSTRLSSRAFSSRIGSGGERGMPDLGNRLGLLSEEAAAIAVWTDTRAGTEASSKQDIAAARAVFAEPSALRRAARYALGYGGVGMALVGLALLVAAGRRRAVRDWRRRS